VRAVEEVGPETAVVMDTKKREEKQKNLIALDTIITKVDFKPNSTS